MFRAPVLAIFSGSARIGSVNTKLAKAAQSIGEGFGAVTTFLDLQSYDLPIYNQDVESKEGMPDGALRLKEDLGGADGWILSSPEYNGFVPPLLLNAMTWASRGDPPSAGMYATFQQKSAIVISASPGAMGGMRSLGPARELLTNLGVNVLPQSVAVGGAFRAFDGSNESGNNDNDMVQLVDPKQRAMLQSAVHSLFLISRDAANRDATCDMIKNLEQVGEYGSVSLAGK
jgi:NAD(P)H-dependent FMN reductase